MLWEDAVRAAEGGFARRRAPEAEAARWLAGKAGDGRGASEVGAKGALREGLSKYELERRARVARNREAMRRAGLGDDGPPGEHEGGGAGGVDDA